MRIRVRLFSAAMAAILCATIVGLSGKLPAVVAPSDIDEVRALLAQVRQAQEAIKTAHFSVAEAPTYISQIRASHTM